jgi:pSer/pThr/pTyr-binding forkhead associated (FHA) protein
MIVDPRGLSMVTLVVIDSVGCTQSFQLKTDQSVFVGTSPNCGLSLDGPGVSEMHCYVKLEGGKLWLEDWMSKTGTLVNGVPITTRTEVTFGDCVQIGPNKIAIDEKASSSQAATVPTKTPPVAVEPCHNDVAARRDRNQDYGLDGGKDALPADSESVGFDRVTHDDEPATTGFDCNFFQFEEAETYDHETVALLRAEIEHLQTALARRDEERSYDPSSDSRSVASFGDDADSVLDRMQELIDEANRSDERVLLLEEMLHAAEDANRFEQEERQQLEAWVGDIEKRVGQREDEHQAELEALRQRLGEANQAQERLLQQLRQAADNGTATKHYQDNVEKLQRSNQQLQDELAEARKLCSSLQQRVGNASEEQERALREERANLAKEHAAIARLRFEVSSKLAAFEELPKSENLRDTEAAHRIKTLREHLREIHEQEKHEEKPASLGNRLARLWQRVEY